MTMVIVGHGKTPQGKRWGKKIDNCSSVMRLWNWHWQDQEDYGERYDYGFFEISGTEMARFNFHNKKTPTRGWVATGLHTNTGKKFYTGKLPPKTALVNSRPWEQVGVMLGGKGTKGRLVLTRGVRAACWAIEQLMPGQSLVLVGFDNVYAGKALSTKEGYHATFVECPAGFPFRDYDQVAVGKTKYGNHDYQVEGPLLTLLADRAGVNLFHAQEVWSA